jgi:hypothetical protein
MSDVGSDFKNTSMNSYHRLVVQLDYLSIAGDRKL